MKAMGAKGEHHTRSRYSSKEKQLGLARFTCIVQKRIWGGVTRHRPNISHRLHGGGNTGEKTCTNKASITTGGHWEAGERGVAPQHTREVKRRRREEWPKNKLGRETTTEVLCKNLGKSCIHQKVFGPERDWESASTTWGGWRD